MHTFRSFFTPSYKGNIHRFYVYRFLYNFMLFLPVWVIFMQQKFDLSLTAVTLNDSAFWLTMALTEVPTGAVADTWGRKQSQLIGMIIATGAILVFALAPAYPLVLFANSLWAFGITFISGADLALFYDTLKELGLEDEYPKFRGRLQAIVLVSIALSSLLGGLIGEINLKATFIITAGLMVIGIVFLLLIKEPPREVDPTTGMKATYRQSLKMAFKTIRDLPGLRYALVYSSVIPLIGGTIQITFIQPHALAIGLPVAALGIIAFGLRASQFVGAMNAQRIIGWFGEWRWLWVAPFLVTVGACALGVFNSVLGIGLFAVAGFSTSVTVPLIERSILRQSPGSVRATILSVDSLLFRVFLASAAPIIGLIADRFTLPTAFIVVGILIWIIALVVLFLWNRLKKLTLSSQES